ncbi:hypothetical protein CYMTET_17228 [Cymbomonas tetramitiformis]|uniref:Uncharacterized protein n=1 Tax=Cymbomonas tetramitiformis TaxID=36881 RepID=A0AAE0L7J0_9CHLO|nr:hypothetical protein CYMTET_17228 [Cymbomonas tetramitiformis]
MAERMSKLTTSIYVIVEEEPASATVRNKGDKEPAHRRGLPLLRGRRHPGLRLQGAANWTTLPRRLFGVLAHKLREEGAGVPVVLGCPAQAGPIAGWQAGGPRWSSCLGAGACFLPAGGEAGFALLGPSSRDAVVFHGPASGASPAADRRRQIGDETSRAVGEASWLHAADGMDAGAAAVRSWLQATEERVCLSAASLLDKGQVKGACPPPRCWTRASHQQLPRGHGVPGAGEGSCYDPGGAGHGCAVDGGRGQRENTAGEDGGRTRRERTAGENGGRGRWLHWLDLTTEQTSLPTRRVPTVHVAAQKLQPECRTRSREDPACAWIAELAMAAVGRLDAGMPMHRERVLMDEARTADGVDLREAQKPPGAEEDNVRLLVGWGSRTSSRMRRGARVHQRPPVMVREAASGGQRETTLQPFLRLARTRKTRETTLQPFLLIARTRKTQGDDIATISATATDT